MLNPREMLVLIDAVSKEKGLSRDLVLDALEEGIATSLKKLFPLGARVAVEIDPNSGTMAAYRVFTLVAELEELESEMLVNIDAEGQVGELIYEPFEFGLSRQQFNVAKQVTMQKLKRGTKEAQVNKLMEKELQLLSGVVKLKRNDHILVDSNGMDVMIPRHCLMPRDNFKVEDKVYFVINKVDNTNMNVVGTRVSDKFLEEVFKREIIQIEEGEIEIKSIARNPGFRSKITVESKNSNINPVKVCIGQRGLHIKNINHFLNGEIVDVIMHDDDPAQLLINAIQPFNIEKISVDEDKKLMEVAIPDEEVAGAIGKNGKNVEMLSKLLGWNIKIFQASEWEAHKASQDKFVIDKFVKVLDVDEDIATLLVDSGFNGLEEIAYVPTEEFGIPDLEADTIDEIQARAKKYLSGMDKQIELIELGFKIDEIATLLDNNVKTLLDVADLGTFDLIDILPQIEEIRAREIIVKAKLVIE